MEFGARRLLNPMKCTTNLAFLLGFLASSVFLGVQAADPFPAGPSTTADFESAIKPILTAHCVSCHGAQKQKAELRIDTLTGTFSGPTAETWHDILNRVELGEMPPEKSGTLPTHQRRQLVSWIRKGIQAESLLRKGIQNRSVVRRLTRYEFNNTLRDLLGIDLDFAQDLPPESSSPNGFKNNGGTLGLSPLQIEYYLLAARRAMGKAIVSGTAPQVFKHQFEESSASNTPKIKTPIGNRMEPGGRFFGKMLQYPTEGEFIVRVRAGAVIPQGEGIPRMQVSIGLRSDTVSPTRVLGQVDVPNPETELEVYEFRGRIEEFPLPGHNPKFPGVTIAVNNIYDDGLPAELPLKIDPIGFAAAEKKVIALAVEQNALQVPSAHNAAHAKKQIRTLNKLFVTLQQAIEELRRLNPNHEQQLALASRLFDAQSAQNKLEGQVRSLSKQLELTPQAFWETFHVDHAAILADHQAVIKRFASITPLDRRDKDAVRARLPAQPQRTTLVVESLEFEGPVFDHWPPKSHRQLLPEVPGDERSRADFCLRQFMTRAYRRPVTDSDAQVVLDFYDEIRPLSGSFEEAMRETFAMVLVSPEFLFQFEPNASQEPRALTQHELATRISYFLWSTLPDPSLMELADQGKLLQPGILEQHLRQMLRDPRTEQLVEHFTDQWLDLSGIERVAVNPEYYPQFDNRLKPLMRQETQAFFSEILRNDLSVLNLIDSDFVMLNEPLAKHYGLKGPKGGAFERVTIGPESYRGGLLTQASILLLNSTGEDSHPIRRAVWLRSRLLDDPPAPPPPDVPELDSQEPELVSLSVRAQLEKHRTKEACNDCHRGIDPWGIPWEQFDAVGQWRETAVRIVRKRKGKLHVPIEAVTVLPNGNRIEGIQQLKRYLLDHEERRFTRAFTSRLLEYSIGRSVTLNDHNAIESLTDQFKDCNYRMSDLIVAIVNSDIFQTK